MRMLIGISAVASRRACQVRDNEADPADDARYRDRARCGKRRGEDDDEPHSLGFDAHRARLLVAEREHVEVPTFEQLGNMFDLG